MGLVVGSLSPDIPASGADVGLSRKPEGEAHKLRALRTT